jgi:hypothetical protein
MTLIFGEDIRAAVETIYYFTCLVYSPGKFTGQMGLNAVAYV